MKLINTQTTELEEFHGPTIPRYAILSHTWEKDEVSFEEIGLSGASSKQGFQKIRSACHLASQKGLKYIWVDTCCIDKSSSSELSEAINSMFHWYRNSVVCFAYLSDLHGDASNCSELKKCRWFTRGWTLQELIAPSVVEFYDANWNMKGTKQHLEIQLREITGIDIEVLRDSASRTTISVARKMAWASSRRTTRTEDIAYCLLGIFDINMPLLYGERDKAFQRLQQEIVRTTHDMTIFGWKSSDTSQMYNGIFAKSPQEFAKDHDHMNLPMQLNTEQAEFSVTNKGIRISSRLLYNASSMDSYILPIGHSHGPMHALPRMGIYLAKFGADSFVRTLHDSFHIFDPTISYHRTNERVIYVLKEVDSNLCELVRRLRCSAIQFELTPAIRIGEALPESLWDGPRQAFLVPEPGRFWGLAYYHKIGMEEQDQQPHPTAPNDEDLQGTLFVFFPTQEPVCHKLDIGNPTQNKNIIKSLVDWSPNFKDIEKDVSGEGEIRERLGLNESRRWYVGGDYFRFSLVQGRGDNSPTFRVEARQTPAVFGDSCLVM